MKTWNETRDVLEAAQASIEQNIRCAIVVLTSVKGSAFRRPGAKLLILEDGSMTGNVSGGCLEEDLRERAMKCIATNNQQTVHYNTGDNEDVIWGLGLGCDGELDLLILPVTEKAAWVHETLTQMDRYEPVELIWNCRDGKAEAPKVGTSVPLVRNSDAEADVFLDRLHPPPELVIVGAGDDAVPLAELSDTAGFIVTIVDHRAGYLTEDRFPGFKLVNVRPESAEGKLPTHDRAMALIKNHALEMDKKWAAFFDKTNVRYIGILGPKKRCAKIREQMSPENSIRVFGPAGIDVGAEGAEQIAISIIAEMLSVWTSRNIIHLRDRDGTIHPR